jgi:co-chaperonin GroES (HSP10)
MKVTQEQFKTVKDQLVVLVPDLSEKSDGGIVIPDTVLAQRALERGVNEFFEVVEKGEDCKSIMIGDFILVKRLDFVPVESTQVGFRVAVAKEYDVVGYYSL